LYLEDEQGRYGYVVARANSMLLISHSTIGPLKSDIPQIRLIPLFVATFCDLPSETQLCKQVEGDMSKVCEVRKGILGYGD
jgi:hypothetical protein